jgi:hypothetical protein
MPLDEQAVSFPDLWSLLLLLLLPLPPLLLLLLLRTPVGS